MRPALLALLVLLAACSSNRTPPPPECRGEAFALNQGRWTPPPQAELERLCR
jgi:hypothetical protein